MAGLLLLELGERLGLQLPGGGARLPMREGPPVGAPKVSMPSEFSSISWMRGGIEPGISIFNVITRSAPARREEECFQNPEHKQGRLGLPAHHRLNVQHCPVFYNRPGDSI